jgi:hypothetical protein
MYYRIQSFFGAFVGKKLELSLKRYYIVIALQASKPDKVVEMFEKLGSEIQTQQEWRDWLGTC